MTATPANAGSTPLTSSTTQTSARTTAARRRAASSPAGVTWAERGSAPGAGGVGAATGGAAAAAGRRAARSRLRRRPARRQRVDRHDQGRGAVLARLRQQRGARLEVGGDRRAHARAEGRGQGQLVARGRRQQIGQGLGAAGGAGVGAQELVGLRELGAVPRRLAARDVRRLVELAASLAGRLGRRLAGGTARGRGAGRSGALGDQRGGGLAALLQLGQLALEPHLVVLGQLGELGLQGGDALRRAVVADVGFGFRLQALDRRPAAGRTLGQLARGALGRVQPHRDPLGRRAGGEEARRQGLALGGTRGERLLGGLAALPDAGQLGLGRVGGGTGGRDGLLGGEESGAGDAGAVARQGPARLVHLALDAGVQLGRLGLALQRLQPRARLALHVQRAIEVVLRALELELGAAAALAVLAEPRGLLDQHPAVARLGGDDLGHAPLRDDRVHLLAQAGVRQDLDHVREPALGAVDAVLALARAVQPAADRDLAHRQVQRARRVVEHDLDLGLGPRLHAVRAREDHVLHRCAANRDRGLLAHRPQHGIRDVGLARAVRADDHRHARRERQPGAVGEGLEALQGDRAQVHASTGSTIPGPSRRRPAPRPSSNARSRGRSPRPRPSP